MFPRPAVHIPSVNEGSCGAGRGVYSIGLTSRSGVADPVSVDSYCPRVLHEGDFARETVFSAGKD